MLFESLVEIKNEIESRLLCVDIYDYDCILTIFLKYSEIETSGIIEFCIHLFITQTSVFTYMYRVSHLTWEFSDEFDIVFVMN